MGVSQENLHMDILRVKGLIWQLLSVDLHTHGTLHGSYVCQKKIHPVISAPPPRYNFPRL